MNAFGGRWDRGSGREWHLRQCVVGLAWLLVATAPSPAAPRVPQDEAEVLEQLPRNAGSARPRGSARGMARADLPAALAQARALIEQSRADGDPRFLGQAQAALASWWALPNPPAEVRLIRATVRQSLHNFSGALADLEACLQENPRLAQAWLTKATLHTVRGEWDSARKAGLALAPLTSRLISATTAASLASVNGQAQEAYDLIQAALRADRGSPAAERLWAMTVAAEIAERLGKIREAETQFQNALKLGIRDGYLLGAYADFLLDQHRPQQVMDLLVGQTLSDGLLLRRALAERRLPSASLSQTVASLQRRFEASRKRGDFIHQREEALFELQLLGHPQRALELARENWQVQREPADVKILLAAALAAGHAETVKELRDWLAESGLEDVRLHPMWASVPGQ